MNSPRFVGVSKNHALFVARGRSVVVNTKSLTASVLPFDNQKESDKHYSVTAAARPADPVWAEIAEAAIRRAETPTDITLAESTKRSYTVPKAVAESASTAINRNMELSSSSKHAADILTSGKQISCQDVLWVARFFDTHEGETTSRGAWLAWGGNHGKRWAQGLASRLDYDSVVADAGMYETPGVQAFVDEQSDQAFFVKMDKPAPEGQHADELFKLAEDGTWQGWGNGDWFSCEAPTFSSSVVEVDADCALYVAGALFDAPAAPVDLRTPNPDAWDLAQAAYADVDWTLVDRAIRAAGSPVNPAVADYTKEERSENTESQIRDGNGRFADVGATGAIKSSGIAGTVTAVDAATKTITVAGDDGQSYSIPSDDFEVGAPAHPKPDPDAVENNLDLEGIVAPAKHLPTPRAHMGGTSGVLGPVQINETLDWYTQQITDSRQEMAKEFKKITSEGKAEGEEPESEITEEAPIVAAVEGEAPPTDAASDVPPPTANPTPDKTDVEPVYLAIVDPDDDRAVMELVALVPATATSSDPKTFRRAGGKWVEDPKILQDMRSATPPPIVQLDAEQYKDVVEQVDMESVAPPAEGEEAVTAAGGADRNNGNAEELRQYWTVGPGGLKIRWQTGGDWTRCVRLLSKHLGNRAKGYCALRHKEMTGMWPGDKDNQELSTPAMTAGGSPVFTTDELERQPAVLRASANAASLEVARELASQRVRGESTYVPIPQTPEDISEGRSGRAFSIPLVIPEGLATGDGRIFNKGSLGMRTLPLPLMWQIQTGSGHDGAVLVGRIDRVERTANGLGNAYGVFDTGPYGQEAQRLVDTKMLRWISADLDKFEIDEDASDEATGKLAIKKGRLMGATLVPKPAFQECTIELVPLEEIMMPLDAMPSAISASASIAAAIPVEPPTVWFDRPVLNGPTPIQVDDAGHVYGHIATWDTTHIGMANDIRPPRSASSYAYFHTGVVRTHEGGDVRVGQLTLAGGHAPIHLDANLAVKHYDDTASAIADVHAGEDSYGIWVSGALRPGTSPEQIRALRASAPSGDWRSINRRLELVAVCQVNVPGFPVPRSMVAGAGVPTALVAAGTGELLAIRAHDEEAENAALVAAAHSRIWDALNMNEFVAAPAVIIKDRMDVRRAVLAYDKLDAWKHASVRRTVVLAARELDCEDAVPAAWHERTLSNESIEKRTKYDALVASARAKKVAAIRARVAPQPSESELQAKMAELRNRIQK